MSPNEYIASLIIKHLQGQLTPSEQAELQDWMAESESHRLIAESFLEEQKLARGILDHWVKGRIWARLESGIAEGTIVPLWSRTWWRFAAAATLVLAIVGFYLVRSWSGKPRLEPAIGVVKQDVAAPSRAHAVITLASGQQIAVDSVGNGTLATQGQVKVIKLSDGQLAYTGQDREVYYNTLSNPRGSRAITLTLPDGTKVWINAASSLRYPTAFTGAERNVEVTGEAYFEVSRNASQPFKVSITDKEQVEVLGTGFNVNAYADEPEIKTTLLEGSIRVTAVVSDKVVGVNTNNEKLSLILKPGLQARLVIGGNGSNSQDELKIKSDVDVEEVTAWKNGRFAFGGVDIQEVMRQVARWYDVQVEYQGTPTTQHFRGGISRSADASQVFKMLETTGLVHFSIQNKKIVVMP